VLPDLAFPLDIGRKVGRRTAEMHLALATSTENGAFAAEPITSDDIERWAADSQAEADRTFAALDRAQKTALSDIGRESIALLQSHKARIRSVFQACSKLKPSGQKIRHHGDFHLGQVLIVKDDLMIVDFEGEPTRTVEERRRKSSPLRDLAGMLRSLDYAAWAALDRVTARGVASPEQMRTLAFAWRDRAVDDCVAEYVKTSAGDGTYPDDKATAAGLLYVFLLRKALYEVRYEVASRPEWLSIPVRGIANLLDRIGAEP
jgi:maltose alpha-D-glucosyltransferase/alpha-amylase